MGVDKKTQSLSNKADKATAKEEKKTKNGEKNLKQPSIPTGVKSKSYSYLGKSYTSLRDIPHWPLSKKEAMLKSGDITITKQSKQ